MEYSYKFRLYPNSHQAAQIQRTFGCCRFVFNRYLALRKMEWEQNRRSMNYYNCSADLTLLKRDANFSWLQEADATALQSSLRDLDTAFQNFFHGLKSHHPVGYPKFKKKSFSRKSYKAKRVDENIAVVGNKLKLPKLGLVKCRISKEVRGRILSATVSQNPAGNYYVSLCCTDVPVTSLPATGKTCGVDLGIKDLAIVSDGRVFPNHKYLRKSGVKLERLQRSLSRKKKDSRRYIETKRRIAKLHEHIANQRNDTIHKATTELIRNYDIICMEDLNTSGMLKNHKLAMDVADASMGEFRRQITYKAEHYGRKVVFIDRFYPSSQTCSHCGIQSPITKDLSVREWTCPHCGATLSRDLNAATNIKKEGLRNTA